MDSGRMPAAAGVAASVLPEDAWRAEHYLLLARLLAAAPGDELLRLTAAIEGADTPLGEARRGLARAAGESTAEAVTDEYFALFIGLGRGELVPFASYYLTGFLHEKPLAKLRVDMMRLGIERAPEVKEPEDHIAAVLEMMAGLITGAFAVPLDLGGQRAFFETHLVPWAERFFTDLERAETARFYRPVGTLGRRFMEIETEAFAMAA